MSWPFAFDSRKWSWTKLFFFRFSLTFLYLLYISFIVVSSNLRNGFILMMVGSSQSQTLQFHIDSMQRPLIFTHNFSKHWISNSEKITNDLSPQLAMVPTLISFCCKIIHIKKKVSSIPQVCLLFFRFGLDRHISESQISAELSSELCGWVEYWKFSFHDSSTFTIQRKKEGKKKHNEESKAKRIRIHFDDATEKIKMKTIFICASTFK